MALLCSVVMETDAAVFILKTTMEKRSRDA